MDSVRQLRTDQVGSLLRPQELLDARAACQAGRLSEAGLSQLEDEAILTALRAQEAARQQIYVDGEFRRTGFMTGFPDSVEGFVPDAYVPIAWKGGTGTEGASPNTQLVIGQRLRPKKRIAKNEADFLQKHAPGPFKLALPSPVNFAVIFWRPGLSDRAYETPSEFLSDAAHILASEARALAAEGTPYLQLDAPLYTHWANDSLKAKYGKLGFDMDRFLDDAIAAENAILDAAAPAVTGVTTATAVSTLSMAGLHDGLRVRRKQKASILKSLLSTCTAAISKPSPETRMGKEPVLWPPQCKTGGHHPCVRGKNSAPYKRQSASRTPRHKSRRRQQTQLSA